MSAPIHRSDFASGYRFCHKRPYSKRSAETARNKALRRRHNRPDHLRIYLCDRCGHWHLTHLTREEAGDA